MNFPLIRRARQEAKEAGLAGPDPVSRLLDTLLRLLEVAMALLPHQRQMGTQRRDWAVPALCALAGAAIGGAVGYRLGVHDGLLWWAQAR